MAELRVSLLGTPQLVVGGIPVSITRRKVVALVAYLSVTGQPQSRETLAALLWPETDAPNAYAYLRNALWLLRQTPLAHHIDVDGDTIGFLPDAEVWVDVLAFERSLAACRAHGHAGEETCPACVAHLERAVELYRGDFMAGFTLQDSAPFDDWQFYEAEALRQTVTTVLKRLVDWHSQPADLETAIAYAQRWQRLDPSHEGAARCLMTLYAVTDQRAAALHVYEALGSTLKAQGLMPDGETISLYRRIRAGDLPEPDADRVAVATREPVVEHDGGSLLTLPQGTVTFLFTDIEGSVALWDRHPEAMRRAVDRHHAILRETIEAHGGTVFKEIGDAFQAAFAVAPAAIRAAVAVQRALDGVDWGDLPPMHVRMGLHTGPAEVVPGSRPADYEVSHTLNRVARIAAAGHGGQILVSQETATLVAQELPPELSLRDLGEHALKGLSHPQRLSQVTAPDLRYEFPALATGTGPRHNLPAESASFVGREAELTALHQRLGRPDVRLITVTGPGGVGKTRLALRLATAAADTFPDGVVFVALAAAGTAARALAVLVETLGLVLYERGTASLADQLVTYLRDRDLLLVLDNFEQVQDGASLIAKIVAETRAPKVIVTSRQRLNLQGEWTLELSGLPWSDGDSTAPDAASSAVRLFIERARQVRSDFDPSAEDREAILRICNLVQGMPLGLELAAAWTKLLSCAEIAEEISRNLDFLSLAMADMPERHRSLRAVFLHSWALLTTEERRCYEALSVFRGSFTRAAAAEVAGASLPLLATLIDSSMLHRTPAGRYEILEVLRQYTEEQLATEPERENAARERHSLAYLGLLQRLEPSLKGPGARPIPDQPAALEAIQADMSNIRAAWRWAVAQGRVEPLRSAVLSLALTFEILSRFREGLELFGEAVATLERPETGEGTPTTSAPVSRAFLGLLVGITGEWCQRLSRPGSTDLFQRALALLDRGAPTPELALVNLLSGYGHLWQPRDALQRRLEESLAFYQEHDDEWGTALALAVIGESLYLGVHNDMARAKALTQQSLAIRRQIGDLWGSAMSLFALGSIALGEAAYEESRHYYRESLEVRKRLRDTYGAAQCIRSLGWIAYRLGELDEAERLQHESLQMLDATGSLHGAADSLENLATIAQHRGNLAAARAYLLEACDRRRALGGTDELLARTLLWLSEVCRDLGNPEAAHRYAEESRIVSRDAGIAAA